MLGSTAPKRVSRGDNSDLSAHIAACLHELVDQGYDKLTIDMYRGSLGHFSYCVTRDKIKWRGHEEASIRRFLTTHLPSCDCIGRHQHDRSNLSAALLHLLRFLRTHGHASAHTPEADMIEAEVQRFDAYLDKICGLAPKTRRLRRDYVRRFLSAHFVRGPLELTNCRPRQIRHFITGATKGWIPDSIAALCGALCSYLRFRTLCGDSTDALQAAVPSVAQWREASLPQALTEVEIDRFLKAFDRRTSEGKRDYAMALCLADLGLRVGEVTKNKFEISNWKRGLVGFKVNKGKANYQPTVPGKNGQTHLEIFAAPP